MCCRGAEDAKRVHSGQWQVDITVVGQITQIRRRGGPTLQGALQIQHPHRRMGAGAVGRQRQAHTVQTQVVQNIVDIADHDVIGAVEGQVPHLRGRGRRGLVGNDGHAKIVGHRVGIGRNGDGGIVRVSDDGIGGHDDKPGAPSLRVAVPGRHG